MNPEHHALTEAFPDKREQLLSLRQQDPDFAQKTDEYVALDKRISRIDNGSETPADEALIALRLERDTRRDAIARELKRASGSCCGGCCG